MLDEIGVLEDVAERLDGLGIAYMLTGSIAFSYYAVPRMTRDIDVVVALSEGDAARLCAAFSSGYYFSPEAVSSAIALRRMFNVIHLESVTKVDLIVQKDDGYSRAEFARRAPRVMRNRPVWVISKEDLVLSKLAWAKDIHSEFQMWDVRQLLATGYDQAYLKSWAPVLGVEALLEECSRE